MRVYLLVALVAALVPGCARDPAAPPIPGSDDPADTRMTSVTERPDGPYRLWGEWTFYIDAENERVDVVPLRNMNFHFNGLKFLEEQCGDCVEITEIRNNGDSTIDMTVQIKHPFPDLPEYTAFDVKGIIMFNGSYEYPHHNYKIPMPIPFYRISWRETGDAELINADGWTPRWAPNWDSGSELPIFNYWFGKYARGTPNADLNAFKNFYTHEERHMFAVDGKVSQTYTIYMPAAYVVAGYAVEACWEAPTVTPVTNPLDDFPPSANQPEAYVFKAIVNNGEVITDCDDCCARNGTEHCRDCAQFRAEQKQWNGFTATCYSTNFGAIGAGRFREEYACPYPYEGFYALQAGFPSCINGNGPTRFVLYNYRLHGRIRDEWAYALVDFTVDDPDLD